MALEIIESCVNCFACLPLCPNQAIVEAKPHFLIDADRCTECLGDYADAQCVAICPIEGAILDELGTEMNPPGSLTGIPPARWAATQAEIGAR
jgi:ferredoxin